MNGPNCGASLADGQAFCAYCSKQTCNQSASTVSIQTPMRTADPSAQTVAIQLDMTKDTLVQQVKEALAADHEVESELGRGGMVVVVRAKGRQLDRMLPSRSSNGVATFCDRQTRCAAFSWAFHQREVTLPVTRN